MYISDCTSCPLRFCEKDPEDSSMQPQGPL
jgi:hypothetical protein